MLRLASRPILKRLTLDIADQLRGLGSLPQAGIAMFLRAADPPALARQPVGLADDQHGKLGLAARRRFVIDKAQDLAQLPHLGPREVMPKEPEHLGVANRL